MSSKIAAYWHKGGLAIYRMEQKIPVPCASGSLEKLSPIKAGLGKKVLIVGRELLLHTRKKYPPAPVEKLFKAVALEIGELFPFAKPAFYCRVFQTMSSSTVVDIWAWESELYDRIRAVFPFNCVIPEDLAFSSQVPEVKIFQYGGMTSLLAYGEGKFLAGVSCPDSGFTQENVVRFLQSLEQYGLEMKRITVYGAMPLALTGLPEISRVRATIYPPCLPEIDALDLGKFKVKADFRLWQKGEFFFRLAIYLVLGYVLMQYLTVSNYDRAAVEIRQKLAALDKKAMSLAAGQPAEDLAPIVREVEEKMKAARSPLQIMNLLAGKLPEETFINRMMLNENNLEITVSSKDPVSALRALWAVKEFKKVNLKGPIIKDRASNPNIFNVVIELAK